MAKVLSDSQRRAAAAISSVVQAWTRNMGDSRPLIAIAMRESALHPEAAGDISNGTAAAAFERSQPKWVAAGNPWANDPSRWGASMGLYQMMPAYHLQRWSSSADPHVLFDPYVATVVAARLVNAAKQAGAQNWVDVRMFWAFGPKGLDIAKDDERYTSRLESETARMKSLGFPASLSTTSLKLAGLDAFGVGPQAGQEDVVAALRGGATTETPRKDSVGGVLAAILAATLMIKG